MNNSSPYLSAKQLEISEWERRELIALVGPLSRDELPFDMSKTCGTACCIGGWVAARSGRRSLLVQHIGDSPLHQLYFPLDGTGAYAATACQAAQAVVNFLTTGRAEWQTVMAA